MATNYQSIIGIANSYEKQYAAINFKEVFLLL